MLKEEHQDNGTDLIRKPTFKSLPGATSSPLWNPPELWIKAVRLPK